MKRNSNKYRVGVYLGKDLYAKLEQVANELGIPISTTIKILLQSGLEFERAVKDRGQYGKQ